MLHHRFASSLRDHFSTVGPSPIASLHTSAYPENASEQLPLQTGSNRLLAFPNSPVPNSPVSNSPVPNSPVPNSRPGPIPSTRPHGIEGSVSPQAAPRPSLPYDLLAVTAHRSAAFFAEAAVLVLVLGILDRFLASNRIELRWISGAFLLAAGLLAASIATDVSARRWLRAH